MFLQNGGGIVAGYRLMAFDDFPNGSALPSQHPVAYAWNAGSLALTKTVVIVRVKAFQSLDGLCPSYRKPLAVESGRT